jgi:hypothetical protein
MRKLIAFFRTLLHPLIAPAPAVHQPLLTDQYAVPCGRSGGYFREF